MSARPGRTALVALALLILDPARAQSSDAAAYPGALRSTLNANKRYPTGREAALTCPEGRARVQFTLDRKGLLRDSGIVQSSGSPILDRAALATIVRTTFPTPPADAWDGPEHSFTVDLDFVPQDSCIPRDAKTPGGSGTQPTPSR